eukprot:TRINITY_DN22654_c0_g1_i1.p3 TRINITY_DN22654_c0_g1~~TRINITY_DN22654_c0_g1_i1.p3  ORF type:complete len:129 (-),score=6.29 TRINITY_DN22654_c0_g1_i1:241-627(-)
MRKRGESTSKQRRSGGGGGGAKNIAPLSCALSPAAGRPTAEICRTPACGAGFEGLGIGRKSRLNNPQKPPPANLRHRYEKRGAARGMPHQMASSHRFVHPNSRNRVWLVCQTRASSASAPSEGRQYPQ